jgi:hypothetical protein
LQENKITPQEEHQQIQAQGRLIADFYTGRLNAAGRDFLMTVLAQVNQPYYLKSPEEIDVPQEMPQDVNYSIVAVDDGVKMTGAPRSFLRFNYDALAEQLSRQLRAS